MLPQHAQMEKYPRVQIQIPLRELSAVGVHTVNILLLNTFEKLICSNTFW